MKRRDWFLITAGLAIAIGPVHSAQKTIELKTFTKVSSELPADFELVVGAKHAVSIDAEADVLCKIGVRVRKGVLMINATDNFKTQQPIRLKISMKAVDAVSMGGGATFFAENISTDQLRIIGKDAATISLKKLNVVELNSDLAGSSTVSMTGKASKHQVSVRESASLEAQPLNSQSALVKVSGAGEAVLNVAKNLDVSVRGAGSVSYQGSPKLQQSVQDAGSVEKIEN